MATCQACTPTLGCPLHPPRQICMFHVEPTDTLDTRIAMTDFAIHFWRMRQQQIMEDHQRVWRLINPPLPLRSARILTWAEPPRRN